MTNSVFDEVTHKLESGTDRRLIDLHGSAALYRFQNTGPNNIQVTVTNNTSLGSGSTSVDHVLPIGSIIDLYGSNFHATANSGDAIVVSSRLVTDLPLNN